MWPGGTCQAQSSNAETNSEVASLMPKSLPFSGMGFRICLRFSPSLGTAKSPRLKAASAEASGTNFRAPTRSHLWNNFRISTREPDILTLLEVD